MTLEQRSELTSRLYKLQSDLGALYEKCSELKLIGLGINVQGAQNLVNEALDELKPDAPENFRRLENPTLKF